MLESKSAALVAAVFVDFPKNMYFFAQKQAWYRTAGTIPRRVAAPYEFFSWGSRHHCPVEVGAYVRWYEIQPKRLMIQNQHDTEMCYRKLNSCQVARLMCCSEINKKHKNMQKKLLKYAIRLIRSRSTKSSIVLCYNINNLLTYLSHR